jgi:hypothetical protein
MPLPEGRGLDQNINPRLTNFAIGYLPSLTQFIARRIFPNIGVGAATGEYNILPRGEWLRPQAKKLSNYEAPPVGGYKFQKASYTTDEFGISKPWTQRDLNKAEVGGIGATRLVNMNTEFVTFQAALAVEIDTAALVNTDANWTVNKTGVAAAPGANQFLQWNDPASTPVKDVKAWKYEMFIRTGFRPNRMSLPQLVVDALGEHPDLIDRVKYTGTTDRPGKVNLSSLAELFEVDEIIVPESVSNTANEGAADVIAEIWGAKQGFLFYADASKSPTDERPSAGYFFSWNGAGPFANGVGPAPTAGKVNNEGLYIARYRTDRPSAEWVESRWYTVPKVTAADLGMRLKSIIA